MSPPIPSPKVTNHHDSLVGFLMPDSLSNSRIELLLGILKRQAKQRFIVSSLVLHATAKPPLDCGTIRMSTGNHKKHVQTSVLTLIWWMHQMSSCRNGIDHLALRSNQHHTEICRAMVAISLLRPTNMPRL